MYRNLQKKLSPKDKAGSKVHTKHEFTNVIAIQTLNWRYKGTTNVDMGTAKIEPCVNSYLASSQAAARASTTFLDCWSTEFIFKVADASVSSSSLLAQAVMFILPNCVPRTIISLLVLILSSFSDNALSLLKSADSIVVAVLGGVDGLEEVGLLVGVVALTGVPSR
ncbi:hypothetical protein IEQ34_018873 [Dendrobium chrysotoxum]|uniref:Uncharacterized protein n=1 Tax=Dendrobium chrysotoxum TaxID=161865 RepID=A0AAV7FPP3_DENCH|nr:hypothetical protein IEQ34_018873 [Dendrobium chrysotoxum]